MNLGTTIGIKICIFVYVNQYKIISLKYFKSYIYYK